MVWKRARFESARQLRSSWDEKTFSSLAITGPRHRSLRAWPNGKASGFHPEQRGPTPLARSRTVTRMKPTSEALRCQRRSGGCDPHHPLYELVRWRGSGSAKAASRVRFSPSSPRPRSGGTGHAFSKRVAASSILAEDTTIVSLSDVAELRTGLRNQLSRFDSWRRGHLSVLADRGTCLRSTLSVFDSRQRGLWRRG